jgi:hypothetical protein
MHLYHQVGKANPACSVISGFGLPVKFNSGTVFESSVAANIAARVPVSI